MSYYLTGDTHGDPRKILDFIVRYRLTENDMIIILGDAGWNYSLNIRDWYTKKYLNNTGIKLFCIHGNHEERPENIRSYHEVSTVYGNVYVEEEFPNLLFAKDGELYRFGTRQAIVIGGAYSVDKHYRLKHGYRWFPSEQPTEETKQRVEEKLNQLNWTVDLVLSHTCPGKYTPVEAFLPGLDQSTVDKSTEEWLDRIEDRLAYRKWFCGHWHIDKIVEKLRFVMDDLIELQQ